MKPIIILGAAACAAMVTSLAGVARADQATIVIPDSHFAPPPRSHDPPLVVATPPPSPPPAPYYDAPVAYEPEAYRSPFRLSLGPMGITTGRSLGMGIGAAADFGRGSVGFRLTAAWLRGEPAGGSLDPSPVGDGLAQYTGELTLDLHKAGPVHPVFGLGFGLAHVYRGDGSGNLGVGTARFGVEYALSLDDADVRLGLGVTGVLPGPAEREVDDVRGYALVGAQIGIGF